MLRRPALDALARAVAVASLAAWEPVAREAGGVLAPLVRWKVRRAIRRAVDELGLDWPRDASGAPASQVSPRGSASQSFDAVGSTVFVLQTAWLRVRGLPDRHWIPTAAATSERYFAELARLPKARLGPTGRVLVLVASVVAIAAAVPLALALAKPAPVEYAAPTGPFVVLPAEREAAWVGAVTDWVIALDQFMRARADGDLSGPLAEKKEAVAAARPAVLAEDLRATFGEPVMAALGAMLDAAEAATRGGSDWSRREEAFATAVRDANRALRQKNLGYFFDSYAVLYDDGRAEAALYTFRIAAREAFRPANGAPVEALHLRRLDSLNIVQFLLGYTSRRMDVAVVLLDKLEEEVSTRLGPALMPAREMPLHMPTGDGEQWWLDVRKRAGQAVREATYAALPRQQQALSELGELLARRTDLVADWNLRLASRQVELHEFPRLEVDADYRRRFEALTSREARKVLDEIQERLEVEEMQRLFIALLARHAKAVERHELQHRLDYAAGDDFGAPPILVRALGIREERKDDDDIKRIAYELSAYTAELARDPEWAHVNLTLLAEHLYEGSGGAEGWSAILVMEGLAAKLGLTAPALPAADAAVGATLGLGSADGLDLEKVAALHAELLAKTPHQIGAAAAALWADWFGHPLIELTRIDDPKTPSADPP